jgi:signal transduction histidine kinase
LSDSQAQRLEEQRIFRQRLLMISGVVLLFGILIVMLISFSNALRKQKKELERANGEIQRINVNLERIVYERTRLLAEANKELDTFLYRASHDLRSPVRSIIGLCNIASHVANPESQDLLEKVVGTTFIMDKLLKKLSMISEINQPTDFSPIMVRNMIERSLYIFGKAIRDNNVTVIVDCPPDLSFESYPHVMEGILLNLIENALFFSLLKATRDARIEITARVKEDFLELSVYDNGIGVEHSIRSKLFDMFFKGHENSKGNGLGLYIVLKSVQTLNGEVMVESEHGQYTKFILQLPLHSDPVAGPIGQLGEPAVENI